MTTGEPCIKCGCTERTNSGKCRECWNEYQRLYKRRGKHCRHCGVRLDMVAYALFKKRTCADCAAIELRYADMVQYAGGAKREIQQ